MSAKQGPPFKSGDVVEVKSLDEIRFTLDADGMYEGIPFMEEMHRFCGRRFRVFKRTDKICVEREGFLDFRRLKDAVLLDEIRCDGSAHDGCQKLCMIFWKEAWLRPAPAHAQPEPPIDWVNAVPPPPDADVDENKVYSCQSTTILNASTQLRLWDVRQYVRDIRYGALRPVELGRVLLMEAYNVVARRLGRPQLGTVLGRGTKTPVVKLGLTSGEVVKVKDLDEILPTLDANGKNRGLIFAYDMVRMCQKTLPVITPVNRMVLETTGKMKKVSNTVLLQGAACSGLCNRGCARYGHPLWREAWLERVNAPEGAANAPSPDRRQ